MSKNINNDNGNNRSDSKNDINSEERENDNQLRNRENAKHVDGKAITEDSDGGLLYGFLMTVRQLQQDSTCRESDKSSCKVEGKYGRKSPATYSDDVQGGPHKRQRSITSLDI